MSEEKEIVPERTSKAWQEYVLSKFEEGELEDGKHPTVGGLRRVSELLIGEISSSKVSITYSSETYCSCVCSITYVNETKIREYEGFADAHKHNTDHPFNLYLAAMAETRARSRAYRNALGLNVVSADETAKDPLPTEEELEPITENQINLIEDRCRKFDINIKKFVNSRSVKYETINVVSHQSAVRMLQELNLYQQTNKDKKQVSPVISGYDKNWRDDFYDKKG